MYILILLTVFTVLLGLLLKRQEDSKNKKLFIIIVGVAIALIMGLRAPVGVGSRDTASYARLFEHMQNVDNFKDYADRSLLSNGWLFSEFGFYFTMWIISRFTASAQVFIFLTSSFMIFCVCRFIYKNSDDVSFSAIAFLTLGAFTFMMNGMRQSIAMCICLLGYEYVKKRKFLPFLTTVLIAMLFHKTAFIFLAVYFLIYIKSIKSVILYFAVSTGFFAVASRFISFYDDITGEDYSEGVAFDSGGITTLLIYFLAIGLAILVFSKFKDQSDKNCFYASIIGAEFYIARFITIQIMERISYYFFFFIILLLPNAINKLNDREQRIAKLLVGIFAILVFAYRLNGGAFRNFRLFFQ